MLTFEFEQLLVIRNNIKIIIALSEFFNWHIPLISIFIVDLWCLSEMYYFCNIYLFIINNINQY